PCPAASEKAGNRHIPFCKPRLSRRVDFFVPASFLPPASRRVKSHITSGDLFVRVFRVRASCIAAKPRTTGAQAQCTRRFFASRGSLDRRSVGHGEPPVEM